MTGLAEMPLDIYKAIALNELHDRNETLFHRVLVEHIEELAPIVYTPTVGRVCLEYGHRFRRPRGMYFSANDKGHFANMLYNWPQKDVHICVVTDGSRILGLGDLGVNGMGIPVGKLALYCAAGGIAPHRVLPVVLDVGTNNQDLLNDSRYLGLRQPRLTGDAYMEIVDEFMTAMHHHFPKACIQFEDFSSEHAADILDRYRHKTLCFNDDIQGTGCVVLAGILSALTAQGMKTSALKDQKILVAGAGSAGLGVSDMVAKGMMQQGLSEAEAKSRFFICDKDGLVGKTRQNMDPHATPWARTDDGFDKGAASVRDGMSLLEVAEAARPTILLGVSACAGLFTEPLVRAVQRNAAMEGERGVIFPLSNPTPVAECTAEQAFEWTDDKCVFASGSPFPELEVDGKMMTPSQCNNMFIFPGVGMGATVARATAITDETLYAAALALANCLTQEERSRGQIFPSVSRIREVSEAVAFAVLKSSISQDIATNIPPKVTSDEDLLMFLKKKTYNPFYAPLARDPYHQ
jgi:malate dehydrogenase (oxaloacetate-decarboxylating)(NADP+)